MAVPGTSTVSAPTTNRGSIDVAVAMASNPKIVPFGAVIVLAEPPDAVPEKNTAPYPPVRPIVIGPV